MSVKQEVLDLIDEELKEKLRSVNDSDDAKLMFVAAEIGLLQEFRRKVLEVKDDPR